MQKRPVGKMKCADGSESDDDSSEDGCVEEPLDGVDDKGS